MLVCSMVHCSADVLVCVVGVCTVGDDDWQQGCYLSNSSSSRVAIV